MHVNNTTYCLLSFLFHQELCEENSETKTKIQQGHLIYVNEHSFVIELDRSLPVVESNTPSYWLIYMNCIATW